MPNCPPVILVIDNYDSFTYNLVQYLQLCGAEVQVKRNDETSLEEISLDLPQGIMLSPGPCRPTESGVCLDIGRAALSPESKFYGIPLFGVCLGHQAIGLVAGAEVSLAGKIMHGKTSQVQHDGRGLFEGVANPMTAARYHSLSIRQETLPDGFYVTARSLDDDEIMGIRHLELPIEGVQFHPESIVTVDGLKLVDNFVRMCSRRQEPSAKI